MTQREMFTQAEMGSGSSSTRVLEAGQLFESGLPPDVAEALKEAEEQILASLQNLNANYTEVGRLLQSVGQRLSRGHFLSWVTTVFGLSPRTARMMMRAAGQVDPSTGALERRQKLAQQRLKNMIRTATAQRQRPKKAKTRASRVREPLLHDRGSPPDKEERQQDGTAATLEDNVDNTVVSQQDTASWSRSRGYAVRWLVRNHGVSAAVAAVIVAELGMGGVL
jgi:hypothetical protein